jgi:hypothetical protein
MLGLKRMYWVQKLVVLFAAIMIVGNVQCTEDCAAEHPAQTKTTAPCHHESGSRKGTPASSRCAHEVTVADSVAEMASALPVQVIAIASSDPVFTHSQKPQTYLLVIRNISPPGTRLSPLTSLRV